MAGHACLDRLNAQFTPTCRACRLRHDCSSTDAVDKPQVWKALLRQLYSFLTVYRQNRTFVSDFHAGQVLGVSVTGAVKGKGCMGLMARLKIGAGHIWAPWKTLAHTPWQSPGSLYRSASRSQSGCCKNSLRPDGQTHVLHPTHGHPRSPLRQVSTPPGDMCTRSKCLEHMSEQGGAQRLVLKHLSYRAQTLPMQENCDRWRSAFCSANLAPAPDRQ